MQTDPALWEQFNSHVNLVLPNVKRVIVAGDEGFVEIRVWPVDPSSDRSDLVVKLADSGTGVAQVLAILCAIMTLKRAVICIDEPGNFLHPGAVKALIGILRQYEHQYVVTTHSLDALISAQPEKVYYVEWSDCVSTLSQRNVMNVEEHKHMLAELGVSLSDIFGMEAVLWVEGETEEICVPIIVQHIKGFMPATHVVVRVRAVSDL
jgi:predicted ATPase